MKISFGPKKLLLITVLFLAPITPLEAVTTAKFAVSNAGWTDLGAGPMLLSFRGSSGVFALADATPSIPIGEGFTIVAGDSFLIDSPSHVWAASKDNLGVVAYVAPATGGGGGGGGVTSVSTSCGAATTSGPSTGAVAINNNVTSVSKSASYPIVAADCGSVFVIPAGTAAGVVLTLPAPATAGSGWNINGVVNLSSNSVSIAGSGGLFNGAGATLTVAAGQGVTGFATDGTNWTYVPAPTGGSGTPPQTAMGYISGYYFPVNEAPAAPSGNVSVRTANTLFCQPLRVSYPGFTAVNANTSVFTQDATATWAVAVYANDPATGKPAALLANTNSVAAGAVNLTGPFTSATPPGTAGLAGATTTFAVPYGQNWVCDTNSAGAATLKLQGENASAITALTVGTPLLGNSIAANALVNGYTCVIGGTCGGGTAWSGTTVVFPTTLVGATLTVGTTSGANFTQIALKVN